MKQQKSPLAQLLPRGAIKEIAEKLGLSAPAVSLAIRGGRPGHPAVAEAVRRVQESGAVNTAQVMASLSG
jgi:predicted transcriptional regulator